jgi:hypothetical protein
MLRAAAQAAAVAAARLGGCGRPHMGASWYLQRLDVYWLRSGRNCVRFENAELNIAFESEEPGILDRQQYDLQASEDRHEAAFNFFYPLELLCVIVAMNLLLRRVSDHASHR